MELLGYGRPEKVGSEGGLELPLHGLGQAMPEASGARESRGKILRTLRG